jgi:Domain of unknown function (DUF4440)
MKTLYLKAAVAVLLAGAGVHGVAQQSHWAEANDATAKMMIDSERKWAEAGCDHNRITETILAEDFMGTAPDGSRYERAREIQGDPAKTESNCKLDGAKVRFFGDNLAMVYGSERGASTGADGKETLRCLVWSDTWLKRNGKWQIISAQDTGVACK